MGILRQVSSRNQVTLPPRVLRRANIRPGDYVDIAGEEDKIVLRPQTIMDKDLTAEEWDKLERLVEGQLASKNYREYGSVEQAKRHLKKLSK